MSTKGRSDYYAPGDWNACCDRCCAKFKASKLRKDWQGFMLCDWCYEPRQPQDFVRGLADPTPLPWVRECSHDTFVDVCPFPTPTFSYTVDPNDPYTVRFTNTTFALETRPNTYLWDFGDGTTSTGYSTAHTFAAGTFSVTLTAYNECTEAAGMGPGGSDAGVTTTPASLTFASQNPWTCPVLPHTLSTAALGTSGTGPSTALQGYGIASIGATTVWASNWNIGDVDPDPPPYTPVVYPPSGSSQTYFQITGVDNGGLGTYVDFTVPAECGIYFFSYQAYGTNYIRTYVTTVANGEVLYTAASPPSYNKWILRDSHLMFALTSPITRIRLALDPDPGSWFLVADIKLYAE